MTNKWMLMTVKELADGIENAEIDAMQALNGIVAEFREEFDLNIIGIRVDVKHSEIGIPPRVTNVDFMVPIRKELGG